VSEHQKASRLGSREVLLQSSVRQEVPVTMNDDSELRGCQPGTFFVSEKCVADYTQVIAGDTEVMDVALQWRKRPSSEVNSTFMTQPRP